jgi:hypothetical protein
MPPRPGLELGSNDVKTLHITPKLDKTLLFGLHAGNFHAGILMAIHVPCELFVCQLE